MKTKLTAQQKADLVKTAQQAAATDENEWKKLGDYFRKHPPAKQVIDRRPIADRK